MELKRDSIPVNIEAERLSRPREIRSHFLETRAARADGESLDQRAVARSTPILVSLIVQLGVSLVYSLLFVALVAFIATELN